MERERTIFTVDDRGVATFTLNRPEKLNAWDLKMKQEVVGTLDEVNKDPKIKILVITGKGRYFGAGIDLKDETRLKHEDAITETGWPPPAGLGDVAAVKLKKIAIAALNGPAVGNALDLSMACDFVIMVDTAFLWEPYVRV
ncbi:enoyl-CoA hydratase/isomerase family protein, partial [Chloroflexota bacterium]